MVVNDAAVFEKFSIDFNAMDVPHKKQHNLPWLLQYN